MHGDDAPPILDEYRDTVRNSIVTRACSESATAATVAYKLQHQDALPAVTTIAGKEIDRGLELDFSSTNDDDDANGVRDQQRGHGKKLSSDEDDDTGAEQVDFETIRRSIVTRNRQLQAQLPTVSQSAEAKLAA